VIKIPPLEEGFIDELAERMPRAVPRGQGAMGTEEVGDAIAAAIMRSGQTVEEIEAVDMNDVGPLDRVLERAR
jgi:hypothetical protein